MIVNVFTSNFAKARSLDPARYLVVSISRFNPKGFSGVSLKDLAPSKGLLSQWRKDHCVAAYRQEFAREMVSPDHVRQALRSLCSITNGRSIVICCYERNGDFCHRHLISEIILNEYGYEIEELS